MSNYPLIFIAAVLFKLLNLLNVKLHLKKMKKHVKIKMLCTHFFKSFVKGKTGCLSAHILKFL